MFPHKLEFSKIEKDLENEGKQIRMNIRLFYLIFPLIVYFFMSLNSDKIPGVLGMNKSLEGKCFFLI